MKKSKKMISFVLALFLVIGSIFHGEVKASAAMEDEAMDFEIGDTLEGGFTEFEQKIYYRFSLDSRQRIVIKGKSPKRSETEYRDHIAICDIEGNCITAVEGYHNEKYWTYNEAQGVYFLNLPVTLNKGTYYIRLFRPYQGTEYAFTTEYAPSTKYPSMQLTLTLDKGDTLKLGAMISPEAAASKLKWKTSDKKIVSVSSTGKIKAKKTGEATITATCNGSKIKVKVIVK